VSVGGFFSQYGLFIVELSTVLVLVVVAVCLVVIAARRGAGAQPGLTVEHLNEKYERTESVVKRAVLAKEQYRKLAKSRKKEAKRKSANGKEGKARVFVLDFKGDIRASATASLREEVTAILAVAGKEDEVFLRLENAGGAVHEHGLAASQLLRLKKREIPLIVAVDKVAASGGYLMACVADRILCAPFAIIGSIGVIAQLPNFHRWLEAQGIDFEQVTAGRFKRTLTLFGENTDEGRKKLQAELETVHELFKSEVSQHRPEVNLEQISTGEHWYGTQAHELGLVDEICTSDDFILRAIVDKDVYSVVYKRSKAWQERLLGSAESLFSP
jgi:serine protease SohB